MPSDARVWIYQSDREFTKEEAAALLERSKKFLESWTAHEQALLASCEFFYNRFLVILLDQKNAMASGCSIDKSMHFIQQLEKDFQTDFLNRMMLAYRSENGVKVVPRNQFEELISSGTIGDNTIVFNNLVQTKADLDNNWEIPLHRSWHKSLLAG